MERKSNYINIPKELLRSLYWGNDYSQKEIAKLLGCGKTTIQRRMKEHNIVSKTKSEVRFSDREMEIIDGCMLGDGGMAFYGNTLCFNYADKNKEFILWLIDKLDIADNNFNISKGSKWGCVWYRLVTHRAPSLEEYFYRWYPNGSGTVKSRNNKVIPHDLELTPVSMLFWYIGDGNYQNTKDSKCSRFLTKMDDKTANVMKNKICELLDVTEGITVCKHSKEYYIIRLNRYSRGRMLKEFSNLGYDVPECYWYKFGIKD